MKLARMTRLTLSVMVAGLLAGALAFPAGRAAALEDAKAKPATQPATQPVTPQDKQAALEKDVTQGALRVVGDDGTVVECPLKHTDVKADVTGFIARVKVTQTFFNPTKEKIEAVYVFPLPHESAVDAMNMVVGQRRIVGVIKPRAEARSIYEQALLAGQTAALLEQQRPNIFTQSVGNIEPGQEVKVEISYVDVLKYDMGTYEFHFPIVVGPRYNPNGDIALPTLGKAQPRDANPDQKPDAPRGVVMPDTPRTPAAARPPSPSPATTRSPTRTSSCATT